MLLHSSYNSFSQIHINYPSFISYCIFSYRSLFVIFILCHSIFLMCIFLYSFIISYIDPLMQFENSNDSVLVDLCTHLHLVIQKKLDAADQFINKIKNGDFKHFVSFIWGRLKFIIIPHIPSYDKDHANENNLHIAFYVAFILIPISVIVINPIQLSTSFVVDLWIANCLYVGDFKSYNSHKLYSIMNDQIKNSLPAMMRSFFVIIGIGFLLYIISEDVLSLLNKNIHIVANNIIRANALISSNIKENNKFLLAMSDRVKKYNIDYEVLDTSLKSGKELKKSGSVVDFFLDAYRTFTNEKSLVVIDKDQLTDKLLGYSADFRSGLFIVAISVFIAIFLVFLIEEIYLPHSFEYEESDMSAFLNLTETFKNSFKHNFLSDFESSRNSRSNIDIEVIFKSILNFIIESRVVIIILIICSMVKVMFDRFLGGFITRIKKNFSNITSLNASRFGMICGDLDLTHEGRFKIIDTCEDLVLKMISPAILEVSGIFLDCCTERITDKNSTDMPIINDDIADGISKFADAFMNNFSEPIFKKIFGSISFIFDSGYKILKNTSDDFNEILRSFFNSKDSDKNKVMISESLQFLSHIGDNELYGFFIKVMIILNRLMNSKFKKADNAAAVEGISKEFTGRMKLFKESQVLDEEVIDRIIEIFSYNSYYAKDALNKCDSSLKKHVVYNLLDFKGDIKGPLEDRIKELFYSKTLLPDGEFDVSSFFEKIGELLIQLIYSDVQNNKCNDFVKQIVNNILFILNRSTIAIYDAKKIASGSLGTDNWKKNIDNQILYTNKVVGNLSSLYSDSQDLFNKLSYSNNLQSIVTDISTRVGVIIGLLFSLVFFFILFKPAFVTYNSVQDVISLIKLHNDNSIFFDESNISSVDMMIMDFENGINIGSYSTLAKGLRLFIDLTDNNVRFSYIYNGLMKSVSADDNLFISIIGDSGAGKTVILNLFSLSNLKLLQNSVNKGEIRCCLTLKDSSRVNVPVDCVDLRVIQRYLNLLAMKQDQPYNVNEFVSTICEKYSGNTALENRVCLPSSGIIDVFCRCGKSILTDLGIWDIYSSKVQRKISEISGGQRQRFGISAMFANMLGNSMDFNILNNLKNIYGKLSAGNLSSHDIDYCISILKNILYKSLIGDEGILKHKNQLNSAIVKLMKINQGHNYEDDLNHVKKIIIDIILSIESSDYVDLGNRSDSMIKTYIFDESLSALNNAVKDNVMKFIRDVFGVNKRKYPTIRNAIAFMVEHGSISIKYADMIIVCYLEDANNSAAVCGTFYEVLNDTNVPLVFKSQILEARLEEILSSSNVSDVDKDKIMNIYKKIQNGTIENEDWGNLPRISLLDTNKSQLVHRDLFMLHVDSFAYLDVVYDMDARSIILVPSNTGEV